MLESFEILVENSSRIYLFYITKLYAKVSQILCQEKQDSELFFTKKEKRKEMFVYYYLCCIAEPVSTKHEETKEL